MKIRFWASAQSLTFNFLSTFYVRKKHNTSLVSAGYFCIDPSKTYAFWHNPLDFSIKPPHTLFIISTIAPAPNKSFGQHYLNDGRVLQRIVAACTTALPADAPKVALEIGPGPGALTKPLLEANFTLHALEKDTRMAAPLALLAEEHAPRFATTFGDGLKVDYTQLVPAGSLCTGNLPYNVGTEMVLRSLGFHPFLAAAKQAHKNISSQASLAEKNTEIPFPQPHFSGCIFMLQKEVILRICAQPGSAHWGRLSIWCQLLADCRRLFDVSPNSFNPPPKVMSSIVHLKPLPQPRFSVNPQKLEQLLQATFTKRRQMLRRTLKNLITEAQLEQIGIAPTARVETLSIEQLCTLSNLLP